MAWASTFIAKMLKKHHWIAYVGLLVVFYIAGAMIWEGAHQVFDHVQPK
jgi:predicted tellurium resistance membrane protein TerC